MKKQNGFVGVILLAIVGMLALGVLGSALNLITIPWLRFDSKVNMERDVVKKTYNADNAIYNSHWFQERAGSIKALDSNIVTAEDGNERFNEGLKNRKYFD